MRWFWLPLIVALVPGAPRHAPARTVIESPAPAASAPAAAPAYVAPLPGRLVVVRPFRAPPTPYSSGHRGVDLGTHEGEPVRAAARGTVGFAGQVAGRGVIVIAHPDDVRTEYEPVRVAVRAGQRVSRGERIGTVDGTHGACPRGGCLHWGARLDGTYFDPMSLLRPLGPVRLLPWR